MVKSGTKRTMKAEILEYDVSVFYLVERVKVSITPRHSVLFTKSRVFTNHQELSLLSVLQVI